ncbi:MAG: DUF554 domain-containing protein [bacterium]
MVIPLGTIINAAAVVGGSVVGILFRNVLAEKYKKIIFQGVGLFTIALGIAMAIEMENPLIVVFSIILGGLIGEAMNLEKQIENLSSNLKTMLNIKGSKFSDGLITAFLIFCIGSMTILGSIQEGIGEGNSILVTKSILDGFTSIALASTFGIGVAFSIIPLIIFQGGLTLLSSISGRLFTESLIGYLSSVGGLLILGIGINLLEIKKIKVINLLPSLLVLIILYILFI